MNNARMKILDMLAEGKISTDEAVSLLEKVAASERVTETQENPPKGRQGLRYLRITVRDSDSDKIDLKIPLSLVRTGIRLSSLLPGEASEALRKKGIDLSALGKMSGDELFEALRDLNVDIESTDGNSVKIFTE